MIILNPQNRQDNHFPSRKEDSILPWHHHAWAYTTGDAIERHNMLTVKERKKSTKRKKENIIIYYINY